MKRAREDEISPPPKKTSAQQLLGDLASCGFTSVELLSLGAEISRLYSLQVSALAEAVPQELWEQIFILVTSLAQLISLRCVCKAWLRYISTLKKLEIPVLAAFGVKYGFAIPRVLSLIKPSSLSIPEDRLEFNLFGQLTNLRKLRVKKPFQFTSPYALEPLASLTQLQVLNLETTLNNTNYCSLTNLTKLSLRTTSVWVRPPLSQLTSLTSLCLLDPHVGISAPEIRPLTKLTKLVSHGPDTSVFISGKGTHIHGSRYDGDWVNGLRQGKGTLTDPVGGTYAGDWVNDKAEGYGVQRNSVNHYQGGWRAGQFHGTGSLELLQDGKVTDRFVGSWDAGSAHGKGTWVSAGGYRYEGNWREFNEDGYGVAHYPDGSCYEGSWVVGKRHGRGRFTLGNASYLGEWRNGLQEGEGTSWLANGDRYEGTWKAGEYSGLGTFFYVQGGKLTAVWDLGVVKEEIEQGPSINR